MSEINFKFLLEYKGKMGSPRGLSLDWLDFGIQEKIINL